MASVFSERGGFRAWSRLRRARAEPQATGEGVTSALPGYGRYLRMLDSMVRQMQGAADAAFLAHVGWVVASEADAILPVDVMSRAAAGAAGRPEVLALARFLVVRSARCFRLGSLYLERSRGVLQLHRQLRPADARVALWLSALYLLSGRYAEAHREAGRARGGKWEAAAARLRGIAEHLMGGAPGKPGFLDGRWDGGVAEGGADGPVKGEPAWLAGFRSWGCVQLLQGRPVALQRARLDLLVRARRGQAVQLVGTEGQYGLSPAEGELALGLLALSWALPGEGRDPDGWIARSRWAAVLWPVPEHPLGRLSGFFSQVVRHLRDKAEAAAGQPVIEVTHRLGYRLRPSVAIGLDVDIPCWVANCVMAALPAPSGRLGLGEAGDMDSGQRRGPEGG